MENASIQQESILFKQADDQNSEDDEDVDKLVDQLKNEEDVIALGETKIEEAAKSPP